MTIITSLYTNEDLLNEEIYLIDSLTNASRESIPELSCIVIARTDAERVGEVCQELSNPNYGEYNLCESAFRVIALSTLDNTFAPSFYELAGSRAGGAARQCRY